MKLAYVAVLVAVLNVACVHAADEFEPIEAKMKALWDGFTSLSYDSVTKADNSTEQFSYKMDSTGTNEMAKAGPKKWKMRSDSKTLTVQKIAGQAETKSESISQLYSDGETMYTYTESQGVKNATKIKVPPEGNDVNGSFFKNMREHYDLKLLADETIEGGSCWAVLATPKQAQAASGAMKYCISKDNGMIVLMEMKDPAGKVMSLTTLKNVKVNPTIAADRFVFTAPPGVVVQDMEALQAQAKAAQEAAQAQAAEAQKTATDAQKKEEPAKTEAAPAKTETTAAKEEPAKTETAAKKEEEPKKKEEKKDTKTKIKKGFGF